MPALTLAQLRTMTKRYAGDVNGDAIPADNVELDLALDTGAGEVAGLIQRVDEDYFNASTTIPLVSGTAEYSFTPTDVKYIRKVTRLINGKAWPLTSLFFTEVEFWNQTPLVGALGGPEHYYLRGGQIGFVPTPTGADTVTVHYDARPATAASQNAAYPTIPDEGLPLVAIKAAIRFKLGWGEPLNDLRVEEARLEQKVAIEAQGRKRSSPRHVNYVQSLDAW